MSPSGSAQNLPLAAAFAGRLLGDEDMESKVSYMAAAAAELGLDDLLRDGQRPLDELASALSADASALYRLMRPLARVDVFAETAPRRFELAPLGRHLQGEAVPPQDPVPWVWDAWGALAPGVRTGRTPFELAHGQTFFELISSDPEAAEFFTKSFGGRREKRDAAVVAAYDFPASGTVVDVGGGRGSLLRRILRSTSADGVLFDLPEMLEHADPGPPDRCHREAGDFFASVPRGGDLYILAQILHDWSDAQSAVILANCRAAMEPGALLVVAEVVVPEDEPPFLMTVLDLEMLVLTGGRERTEREFRGLLDAAGFEFVRTVPTESIWSVVEARAV